MVLAVLSAPVFLISYGFMLKHALTTWPWWASAITIAAHITGWLGISALLDSRQERRTKTQAAQS